MKNIIVLSYNDPLPQGYIEVNTTSRDPYWGKYLSPFHLTNIQLYDNVWSYNMENAWQYSKVYEEHIDKHCNPSDAWYDWSRYGFSTERGVRYPMGKGRVPLYTYYKINEKFTKLSYIEARRSVYIPLYANAVVKTEGYKELYDLTVNQRKNVALRDFDGYNHKAIKLTLNDVFDNPKKKAGHAFVLYGLLSGQIKTNNDIQSTSRLFSPFTNTEYVDRRVTPENITNLSENEIFVFGSNLSGIHGLGAAKTARHNFGAVWGVAAGLMGKSYGIPTKGKDVRFKLALNRIRYYVDEFIEFVKLRQDLTFYVTAVGCGLAGYKPSEIAPLFNEAVNLENVYLPSSFLDVLI